MTIPGSTGAGPVTDAPAPPTTRPTASASTSRAVGSQAVATPSRTGAPGPTAGTPSPVVPTPDAHDASARGPRPSALSRGWVRALVGALLPLAVLGVWQWVTSTGAVPPYRLPEPASVWTAAVDLAQRGQLGLYVAISTQRVLVGFAIGAALGLLVGAFVGLSRVGAALLSPSVGALRAVPSLAWIPLLFLWMQLGEEPKITLVAIGAFFPVYTTVAAALRHVDPHLVEVGRAYGLAGVGLFARVQLPAVLPSVVSGLRLGLAQSWLFLVAAELMASSMGLGFLLTDSANNGRVDRVLLAILLLALLGKTTDSLIGLAEKHLLRRWS